MNLRPLTLLGTVISMVTGVALGIIGYREYLAEHEGDRHARAFGEVLAHVHANYVDEVGKDELVTNALKGMLEELDDHSLYLDSADYHDLQADTTGHFGGIGVEITREGDHFTVIAPIAGTPAERAGLQPGDRLVEIDHEPVAGRSMIDVVETLRGEPGSPVHVRVERRSQPRDVELERALVSVASVDARLLEPGYGYVRITQFTMDTAQSFEAAVANLQERADGTLHGLVLDLRNNPGGVLQASVAVADALLEEGLIVYTEGRLPSSQLKYRAAGGDLLESAPVVVLINGGSASAAEIVAGALQDHDRATVMGLRSYGKGSVQSVLPLTGDKAIKLTTAYYFTPDGRSIHHAGIEPDVATEAFDDRLLDDAVRVLKQRRADRLHAQL
ncbi:MAG: S41 family peptidase [Pseudomonadota bacterium]